MMIITGPMGLMMNLIVGRHPLTKHFSTMAMHFLFCFSGFAFRCFTFGVTHTHSMVASGNIVGGV